MGVFTFSNIMAAIQMNGLGESFLLPMILNMSITGSLAILFVLFFSMARCLTPLASLTRKLRRASRVIITENKHLN